MAELRTNIASIDPVWDQITEEARQAVSDEPLIGGFVHACILHHKSIEKALSYRIAAKLASNEMSMVVVREMVEDAYSDDPGLVEAARADLVARASEPFGASDVLVNNAAGADYNLPSLVDTEARNRMFDINVNVPVELLQGLVSGYIRRMLLTIWRNWPFQRF